MLVNVSLDFGTQLCCFSNDKGHNLLQSHQTLIDLCYFFIHEPVIVTSHTTQPFDKNEVALDEISAFGVESLTHETMDYEL